MKTTKILLLFAIVMALSPLGLFSQNGQLEEISPIRARLMVRNGAMLIDVREKNEVAEIAYDAENVINLPLSELADRLDEVPKDQQLIMACRSGNRSRKAGNLLLENGR